MAEAVQPVIYGVAEVNYYLRQYLEEDPLLSSIAVRGEISGFKAHSSGHVYFTLREGESGLKSVLFRRYAAGLNWQPKDGDQAVVVGRVSLYERDGACQLYAEMLLPAGGIGDQQQAFEQLKARLEAEGLFAESRKRPLPRYALDIGVITAAGSAAWADMQRIIKTRCKRAKITLYPALVQGEQAPASLAAAMQKADAGGHQLLICGRGGGAGEDLAAFNSEQVVRAFAASRTPLISAVGHESDFTLADLAADVRAATPTHAATMAVPESAALLEEINLLQAEMQHCLRNQLQLAESRLQRITASRWFSHPQDMLSRPMQQLDYLEKDLRRVAERALLSKKEGWLHALNRLQMLDPLQTLQRGYAVVQGMAGESIRDAAQSEIGDILHIRLAKGALISRVEEIKQD